MKRVKININLSNRWLYTFIAVGIMILLGVVVYAVAGVSHSASELTGLGTLATKDSIAWSEVTGVPAGFADGVDAQLTEAQVDTMVDNNGYLTSKFIGFTDAECTSAGGSGSTTQTINSLYWGSIKICKTRIDVVPSGWALIGYYHDAVSAPSCYSYQSSATPDGWSWYAIDDPSFRGAGFPFEASPFLPTKCPACSSSTGSCTIPARFQELSPKITSDSSCINTGWRTVDVYCRNIKWQKLEFDYVVISKFLVGGQQ